KSRICFQNFTGGTANLISGYTQKDSDGSLYTGKPAKLSGGLPGAKMATSCPISASCSIVRIRRVTTPSILGRKTSVTIAIRTNSMRFRTGLLLRPAAVASILAPEPAVAEPFAPEHRLAAPWSTRTVLGSSSDPRGRRTCGQRLRLLAVDLQTTWWAEDQALRRCHCARAGHFPQIPYVG